MAPAEWKRKLLIFGQRLIAVGSNASRKQNREICILLVNVLQDAMYHLLREKGEVILMTKMYREHYEKLQMEKARLSRPLTNQELRETRDGLLNWKVKFIADSATVKVVFPERLDELLALVESMPQDEELPEPWPEMESPVPWYMQPGRPSQDAPAPHPQPRPRQRTVSDWASTRPSLDYSALQQHPQAPIHHQPGMSPRQSYDRAPVGGSRQEFQRGHSRNVLSMSSVGGIQGSNFATRTSTSTSNQLPGGSDRSSTSSTHRSQATPSPNMNVYNVASPYNPVPGVQYPAYASMFDLTRDSLGQPVDESVAAYMQQQGWVRHSQNPGPGASGRGRY